MRAGPGALGRRPTVVGVIGTRPEVIKLAPVVRALDAPGGTMEAGRLGSWAAKAGRVENPFGAGDSGPRIARLIGEILRASGGRAGRA